MFSVAWFSSESAFLVVYTLRGRCRQGRAGQSRAGKGREFPLYKEEKKGEGRPSIKK